MAILPRQFNRLVEMLRAELAALRGAIQQAPFQQERHHWRNLIVQLALAVGTWFAFIAAALYAWEAHRQLCVMQSTYSQIQSQTSAAWTAANAAQQEAKLMGQQLEGTMAAVLKVNMEVNIDNATIGLALMNAGHVVAKNVHVKLKAVLRTLPNEETIGGAVPVDYVISEIGLTQDMWQQRQYPIHLSKADESAIRKTQETVRLEGGVSYFDGFKETTMPVCFGVLAFEITNRDGRVLQSGNNPQVPCDELDISVAAILRQQRKALKE